MRKLKYLFWIVIIAVLVLFVYQNSEYFMDEHSISINLYFFEGETAALPNLVYFVAVFLIGFLVSFIMSFSYGYKKRKTIKQLNQKIDSDKKLIDELESRLATVEGSGTVETGTDSGDYGKKAVDAEFSSK